MTPEEKLKIEEQIVEMLKTVYDPEIPVDIYNLGLIYNIDLADDGLLDIDMTLTAPNCPAADFIVEDVRIKTSSIPGIKDVRINLVFEPEWDRDMMSEEAGKENAKGSGARERRKRKERKPGKRKQKGSEEREGWKEKTKAVGGKKRNVGVTDGHFPSCTSAPTSSCAACCMMA